jgi:hypothetical protein
MAEQNLYHIVFIAAAILPFLAIFQISQEAVK